VPALQLQGFVHCGKDPVGRVRGSRDIGVGEDGQELRRRSAQDSRGVDVTHGARERSGHGLERIVGSTAAI